MNPIKLFVLALIIISYLFFSYVRFYHIIGDLRLSSPFIDSNLILENVNGVGATSYVALGDSLSAGVGSQTLESTFVYNYALKLSEKYKNVKLLNLAQPGGTTVDVINNQIGPAIAANPDHVTLLIGTNDIHNKRTAASFREKYQYILSELLSKTSANITVMNVPYLGDKRSVYFPFNLILNYRTQQFNKVIEHVVNNIDSKERVRFIDLYKNTYNTSKNNPDYYSVDLFHPSESGYNIWSKIINAN